MKEIMLTSGMMAIVDDEYYEELNKYNWFPYTGPHTFYAIRNSPRKNGERHQIMMHREILGLKYNDGNIVDHKNRNGLDNRKGNLQLVNKIINGWNRNLQKNNKSGYIGVSWHKDSKRWRAQFKNMGKIQHCGIYKTPEEAAMAYDREVIKKRGAMATLNFPLR